MPTGLGDEQLWVCPTISGTGTASDITASFSLTQQSSVTVVSDTGSGGSYAFDMPSTTAGGNMVFTDTSASGVVSASFWANPDATAYGRVWGSSANSFIFAALADGSFHVFAGGGWESVATYAVGNWNHISVVADGYSIKVYVDGTLELTSAKTDQFPSSQVYYGGKDSGGDRFNGQMDDMRLYDRTLTQAEITHLATSRGVLGRPFVGLGDEQLWLSPTNDNTGTSTAYDDQSGQGNNGTNNGSTVVSDTSSGGTYAFEYNAAGEIIEVSGLIGTTVGSLSMWVKRSAVQNTTMWFEGIDSYQAGGWDEAFYSYNGDRIICGNAGAILATNLPSSGSWFHLSVLNNSGNSDIYVNGVFQESATTATAIALATSLKFGCCTGSTVSLILQDDIRVFDRLLTQSEITHLATSRGVLGPPGGATHYNPFKTHAFTNNFQQRLR